MALPSNREGAQAGAPTRRNLRSLRPLAALEPTTLYGPYFDSPTPVRTPSFSEAWSLSASTTDAPSLVANEPLRCKPIFLDLYSVGKRPTRTVVRVVPSTFEAHRADDPHHVADYRLLREEVHALPPYCGCRPYSTSYKSADIGANQISLATEDLARASDSVECSYRKYRELLECCPCYPPPATRRSQPSAPAAAIDDDGGSLPKLLVFSVCDDFGDRDRGEMWEI